MKTRQNAYFSVEGIRNLTQKLKKKLQVKPHFDYTCLSWKPNLTQKLKKKLQVMQNKCIIHFCLQLDRMPIISHKEFKNLNWLPVITRFEQCVNSMVFKPSMAIVHTT